MTTPYHIASNLIGLHEITGKIHNGFISWCFSLCNLADDTPDEWPWCAAFINGICHLTGVERTRSARARSWLTIGQVITLEDAVCGFDVVILKRGGGDQPGADVIDAPGHVGFYDGVKDGYVSLLGGNQGDKVSIARFPVSQVLGVRRLL